jgi:hypothetical protein
MRILRRMGPGGDVDENEDRDGDGGDEGASETLETEHHKACECLRRSRNVG